jgi:hypothetical protein
VTAMKGRILLAAIFILALSWRGGFAADYYTLSGATDAGAYANCNGNYYLNSIDSNGKPVYKHETQNYYLYLGFFMADYFWLIDVDLNDDDWHFGYYRQAYGATTPPEGTYNRWSDASGALPVLTKHGSAPDYTLSGATDEGAYAGCNGNYSLYSFDSDGKPIYKHVSQNYYLYLGFFMADYFWVIDVDLNVDDWHFGYYRQAYGSSLPLEGTYNRWSDANGALPVLSKYSDASLSVGLASFSASQKGSSVVLNWTTESEVDNAGFILERSEDGISWTTIASYLIQDALKGQGNTSSRTDYSFTDTNIQPGKEYQYRLSDVSTAGVVTAYAPISIKMDALPGETAMENAYPNPFNPKTFIAYKLAEDTDVNISVFDMLGRRVKQLFDGRQSIGSYHVYWNGTTESGRTAPSGGYVIRMKTETGIQTQKVILMK